MPYGSSAPFPRFSMAIKPSERETISFLAHVRDQTATDVIRDLLAEAAKRHAAEIEAYKALRATAKLTQDPKAA
jgi:hypothetical protein